VLPFETIVRRREGKFVRIMTGNRYLHAYIPVLLSCSLACIC
jgi:hypothetical protein